MPAYDTQSSVLRWYIFLKDVQEPIATYDMATHCYPASTSTIIKRMRAIMHDDKSEEQSNKLWARGARYPYKDIACAIKDLVIKEGHSESELCLMVDFENDDTLIVGDLIPIPELFDPSL